MKLRLALLAEQWIMIKSIFLMIFLGLLRINNYFLYFCTRIDVFILPQIAQMNTEKYIGEE